MSDTCICMRCETGQANVPVLCQKCAELAQSTFEAVQVDLIEAKAEIERLKSLALAATEYISEPFSQTNGSCVCSLCLKHLRALRALREAAEGNDD